MSSIVLATQNQGKVHELRALLDGSTIEIIGLADLEDSFPEPDETGTTFLENATIKAVEYARMTKKMCLADDSGLVIDALGGRPGVISSHYAFDGVTEGRASTMSREQRDLHNIDRVLAELEDGEDTDRSARFVCVMVLADADGKVLATSEGKFEGRIGYEIQGENGFGYDPIFLVGDDDTRTSAQLDPDEKNAVSHRGSAVRSMIDQIKSLNLA